MSLRMTPAADAKAIGCDVSRGRPQCPYVKANGPDWSDGYLCCGRIRGHAGPHYDAYAVMWMEFRAADAKAEWVTKRTGEARARRTREHHAQRRHG